MSDKTQTEKTPTLSDAEADLIWDEYKYRHQHCWNTVFKLTGAAVLLGLVPYLEAKVPRNLGYWLLSPPILAIALIILGMLRMRRELLLLDQVRKLYRKRQHSLYGWHIEPHTSFNKHVLFYLLFLLLLAIVNVAVAARYLSA